MIMSIKMRPITVIMSVYNGEEWLNKSIPSVLNQTYDDFEFIIINDGSTDRSSEIIEHYANVDSRIIAINKENSGLADSLNCGIKYATGKWIARIDADDICDVMRLEKQYSLAQSNKKNVLIGAGIIEIDSKGNTGKIYKYPKRHKELKNNLTTEGPFFAHSTAFYLTEMVRSVGGYRERFQRAQDHDLWLRLSEVGKMACVDEPLIKIRRHNSQISNEDDGMRQKIDSKIALISYWLRKNNYVDPVDRSIDDQEYDRFRAWVINKMMKRNVFGYHEYIKQIKRKKGWLGDMLGWQLFCAPEMIRGKAMLYKYFYKKIFGDYEARDIAFEWMMLPDNQKV